MLFYEDFELNAMTVLSKKNVVNKTNCLLYNKLSLFFNTNIFQQFSSVWVQL